MTGKPVALDTNRAIALLNGAEPEARWVARFSELCLPVPVVGELRYGALNSKRAAENIAAVQTFVDRCRVLPADAQTARIYGEARARLKRAGRPIPENDVWIASICLQHSIGLATTDGHFSYVEGLEVVAQ